MILVNLLKCSAQFREVLYLITLNKKENVYAGVTIW